MVVYYIYLYIYYYIYILSLPTLPAWESSSPCEIAKYSNNLKNCSFLRVLEWKSLSGCLSPDKNRRFPPIPMVAA